MLFRKWQCIHLYKSYIYLGIMLRIQEIPHCVNHTNLACWFNFLEHTHSDINTFTLWKYCYKRAYHPLFCFRGTTSRFQTEGQVHGASKCTSQARTASLPAARIHWGMPWGKTRSSKCTSRTWITYLPATRIHRGKHRASTCTTQAMIAQLLPKLDSRARGEKGDK